MSVQGARVLCGGRRQGALLEPTVIGDVPLDAEMVVQESFGPLAPILAVDDLDDAIQVANRTAFGLSGGTNNMNHAVKAVRGIRAKTVNKEGVIEAIRFLSE